MKQYQYSSKQFKQLLLKVNENILTLEIDRHRFMAMYPRTFNLEMVEKGYFDLLMFILFYGIEDIDISKTLINVYGNEKIVSYSGGADSTAVLDKFGGIPVHVLRYWSGDYEQRQIRAVINVSGINIPTDFEKVRELYTDKTGFNIGIGYTCLFFPIMPMLKADTIYFGVVFDDISFYYGDIFKYTSDFSTSRTYKIIQAIKKLGIKIQFPMAGYSEVLTTRIADAGRIKNYSSCNVPGTTDKCLNCYKCFRKEAIRGNQIDFKYNPKLFLKVQKILGKFPLKMASSTIYGIQHAGYNFDVFKNIDVSFLDRVNPHAQQAFFNGDKLPDFEWQTDEDMIRIKEFVKFINDHRKGFEI